MIEVTVKEHMESKLDAPVYFEFPEEAPDYLIVVKKDGNPRENLLDSAMIIVDSYGPSLLAAAMLNERVKAALDDLVQLPTISASRRGGDYPFFDTKNKRYRYQAVQNITHY